MFYLFIYFFPAPLVKIKQALQRLKGEVTQMDVRIGVVEHSLLQARLKDKNNFQKDMNEPVGTFAFWDQKIVISHHAKKKKKKKKTYTIPKNNPKKHA